MTGHRRRVVLAGVLMASGLAPAMAMAQAGAPPLLVHAAGSLREAFTEVGAAFEAAGGPRPVFAFGASGLLRERIERGEPAQVFASADTEHPGHLASAGGWRAPIVFTRNALCALTSEQIALTPDTLLAGLLQPGVRVGTSTPGADPSGDYAWALFRKADGLRPGAYAVLDAKALKLTGGADSPRSPPGRGTYAWVMDSGQADVFLTYCTNAVSAQREVPRLKVVELPASLQVGAAYGLTVRDDAPAAAGQFARFLLTPPAQHVLRRLGFGAP